MRKKLKISHLFLSSVFIYILFTILNYSNLQKNVNNKQSKMILQLSDLNFENITKFNQQKYKKEYTLLIGISTIPRIHNPDYLVKAVKSLIEQYDSRVLIYVQNNSPKGHYWFNILKKQNFKNVFFYDNGKNRMIDPYDDIPGHDYKHPDNMLPGKLARQQSCDVISTVKHALYNFKFKYFMFMEDDFIACENMISTVLNILDNKLKDNECGLRISYGMNGVLLNRDDTIAFINYVEKNFQNLPIDLLIREFMFKKFCPPNRVLYVYKQVLLEHIGGISTFPERNNPNFRFKFPKCKTSMSFVWNLCEEERFSPLCNHYELSPC